MEVYGVDTLVRFFSHLAFIYLAFWSLQSLRLDMIFKKGQHYERQIKMFYVFLSIVLGYTSSSFFLEVMYLMRNLFNSIG
ncbi:hypothetical protein CBF34_04645 [Vagococcus penaei]|uniref:Uncharacterized protein n=1 Tax=Vagococcus penaei TaxID=633807 RepID=A0A1Q2D4I6_9ENTE|nr:DUF1146 family protein [Vagococcus penaei]AQP53314.1 hypothetical protein BW732_03070 [Vagococcus penaei]RSU04084.1 hypothetical protein CBF34_04645 [Vagococcus penaei]